MDIDYLIQVLDRENMPVIIKGYHTYLSYYGFEENSVYVMRQGIAKTSIIHPDGREFNLAYISGANIISLLKDEVSKYTSSPLNVRIESKEAAFFRVPRTRFWELVRDDPDLHAYVRDYYRQNLSYFMETLQAMTMNGKTGAVCFLLQRLAREFGQAAGKRGEIEIQFSITNEDIAGFCGISQRSSVNRILHGLKADGLIEIEGGRIIVLDLPGLKERVAMGAR